METSPEPSRAANHLQGETSPYLLQHVYNPVDWYPWGEEALEKARAEDRPIFLSIGYSACHWCHVMERESFENQAIAELLNAHFVCIKVDREERPDLDEIYMTAVVSLTGSGGWPMSVFLTPSLEPFYGGTYYPPVDMYGRPGFPTVLTSVANAWKNRREEVEQSAQSIAKHLRERLSAPASNGRSGLSQDLLMHAARQLRQAFDAEQGGWGGAPKFPSSGSIQLLLRAHAREQEAGGDTAKSESLRMVDITLERMARGGVYDHLGGGFHRYSVDAQWLVPHFEKMLYDNAQLAQAYLEAYQVTGNTLYRRIVEETLDYEMRDMQEASGGFHSTEDADSEGEEGKYYVWTYTEVLELLGAADAEVFAAYYNVRREGNFESHESYHRGKNILHVTKSLEEVAAGLQKSAEEVETVLKRSKERLYAARQTRTRPGLDDKILTSWNGLMITALAQAAQTLETPRYAESAVRAGTFLWEQMVRDGKLLRTHRNGVSRLPGYLDDYAFTANAFVDLYEATFDLVWLERARTLADWMLAGFWDDTLGAFYHTSAEHQHLLVRTSPTYDGAEPSGNSIATLALLRLHHFHNLPDYYHKALELLERNHLALAQAPQGYLKMLCAADYALGPVKEVVIIGGQEDERTQALLREVRGGFTPRTLLAWSAALVASEGAVLPLFMGRTLVNGLPAAYVCENYTCEAPVTDPAALREKLK